MGLTTLVITDLDAVEQTGHHSGKQPERGQNLLTGNNTLKDWIPQKQLIDDLLNLPAKDKEVKGDEFYAVRVAYQIPVTAALNDGDQPEELIPNSFEDAFVFDNIKLMKDVDADGLLKKCSNAVNGALSITALNKIIYDLIKANGKLKAEFSLDLLYLKDPKAMSVPTYIKQGLEWLNEKIKIKRQDDATTTILLTQPQDTSGNG